MTRHSAVNEMETERENRALMMIFLKRSLPSNEAVAPLGELEPR